MARRYACFVLVVSIAALSGCSSAPGAEPDAGAASDAASGDGGARDGGTIRDGSLDAGPTPSDTGVTDDASADASAGDDAGTDASAGDDAGTDAGTVGNDAGSSMPHCTGAQEMCTCATGWYCAPRGSFCLNPAAPCP